jgi:hypothetical protein
VGQVTGIVKEVPIPGEDEQVIIRRLSHKQLKEAAKARQSEGVGFMKEMGGELLKAIRDTKEDAEATAKKLKELQEKQESDVSNYDRDVILKYGVVSWSYPIAPLSLTPNGVSNGLDELDEDTAKFLAKEIFEYSRPLTQVEAKKDLSVSTVS